MWGGKEEVSPNIQVNKELGHATKEEAEVKPGKINQYAHVLGGIRYLLLGRLSLSGDTEVSISIHTTEEH